jgi:short-subunit dehydrogenase
MFKVGFLVRHLNLGKPVTNTTNMKTALITGASSGLGAEFSRQLAASGYNLIITARRENLLQQLAESLRASHSIDVQVIPADLSELTFIDKLVEVIKELPRLDLLVNNAGFGTVGNFYQVDPDKERSMLNVHVHAPVLFSRAALPGMLSRHRGGIITVASIAGLIPIRNVLYHSTKAFQVHFCEVLRVELRGTGVHVQALCPGYTQSAFHDTPEYTHFTRRSVPRFLWMTSQQVVAESLRTLAKNKLYCFPGPINKLAGTFARISFTSGLIKQIGRWMVYRQKAL